MKLFLLLAQWSLHAHAQSWSQLFIVLSISVEYSSLLLRYVKKIEQQSGEGPGCDEGLG